MKRFLNFACVFTLLFVVTSSKVSAATFNVTNASQLQTALTTAAGNGVDDTINIAAGNYSGNSFVYNTTATNALNIYGDD